MKIFSGSHGKCREKFVVCVHFSHSTILSKTRSSVCEKYARLPGCLLLHFTQHDLKNLFLIRRKTILKEHKIKIEFEHKKMNS